MSNKKGFEISFSEVSQLIDVFQKLINGVSRATKMPKEHREEMRDAILETCEMIQTILINVKQRISIVHKSVKAGHASAKEQLKNLADEFEWEHECRTIQLCLPLAAAASEINRGLMGKWRAYLSFSKPRELTKTIDVFLKNEVAVGQFVGKMLHDLSELSGQVGRRKKFVLNSLDLARRSIRDYNNKFVALEIKLQGLI